MTVAATRRNVIILVLGLSGVLALVGLAALMLGSVRMPLAEVWAGVTGSPSSPEASVIIRELGLPLVLLAMMVGAALAVSGTALQAMLRNPLAEPYVLGISSGAALGAIFALWS